MSFTPELPRLLAREGARRLALGYLNEAAAARGRLPHSDDTEALHDFRVAIRRLRSCLRTYRPEVDETIKPKTLERLERLGEATRTSRDLQVHVEWLNNQGPAIHTDGQAGAEWLIEQYETELVDDWTEMLREVDRNFARVSERLTNELGRFRATIHIDDPAPRSMAKVASARLRIAAAQLERRLGRIHAYSDQRPIHRARIAAKHLRYGLDPFRDVADGLPEVIDKLKGLQDVFGDIHDVHVFAVSLSDRLAEAGQVDAGLRRTSRLPGADATGVTLAPGLAAVAALLRRRGKDAFERARRDWLDGAGAGFFEELDQALDRVAAAATAHQEIERKFLLDRLPAFDELESTVEIEQGYLPGDRVIERLRRTRAGDHDELVRTVKLGSGLSRIEVEEPVKPDVFAQLWPLTEGRRLWKRRHRVKDGDLTWEIDEFPDRNLVMAEIELPSATFDVSPPAWLRPHVVREVTNDPAFSNFNLARDATDARDVQTFRRSDVQPGRSDGQTFGRSDDAEDEARQRPTGPRAQRHANGKTRTRKDADT